MVDKYRIIDGSSTGKTSRLMLLAKENDGVLVTANPFAMKEKARNYGIFGFDIISYLDFADNYIHYRDKAIFIDELENFIKDIYGDIDGYSMTIND